MAEGSGRGALIVTILIFGVLLAAANAIGLALVAEHLEIPGFSLAGAGFTEKIGRVVGEIGGRFPAYFFAFFALPIVLFAFTALLVALRHEGGGAAAATAAAGATAAAPESERAAKALQLLAVLQREGRFLDFVEEEIDGYSDEQVGAAARTVHGGCRKALHERMDILRLRNEEDGAGVEIGPDYDPQTIRLTGNVHGAPPFRGTLEHGGWRVANLRLPETTGGDPTIVAPAEVEIP